MKFVINNIKIFVFSKLIHSHNQCNDLGILLIIKFHDVLTKFLFKLHSLSHKNKNISGSDT